MTKFETTLTEMFAEMDEEFIARQVAWAEARVEAVRVWEKSQEYADLYKARKYERLSAGRVSMMGGKSWYTLLSGRDAEGRADAVTKNCKRTIAARNASISAKLTKVGATEIEAAPFARSNDGFHGTFVLVTDAGKKRVKIETIVAGGYNIQCLHLRTLVKVMDR